jgi:hypothetical protein
LTWIHPVIIARLEQIMDFENMQARISQHTFRCLTALLCAVLLVPGEALAWVARQEPQAAPAAEARILPGEQLDSLVAPIALYPDPLLAQVLAASHLEIISFSSGWEAQDGQGIDGRRDEGGLGIERQAMAVLPDVVKHWATTSNGLRT